ncbi:MAG: hypothetical protein V7K68_30345 [Nostoc sp.]|uniref:hypothetical protein n=1 Tax=Nostoc sp. TaxID=1180 RepID=UPI002FF8A8C2
MSFDAHATISHTSQASGIPKLEYSQLLGISITIFKSQLELDEVGYIVNHQVCNQLHKIALGLFQSVSPNKDTSGDRRCIHSTVDILRSLTI